LPENFHARNYLFLSPAQGKNSVSTYQGCTKLSSTAHQVQIVEGFTLNCRCRCIQNGWAWSPLRSLQSHANPDGFLWAEIPYPI